jgi:hypothetical protein
MTTVINGQEQLMVLEPMSFSLQTATEVVKSTKFNTEGQIVNAGVAKRKIESVLTLGIEAINWFTMQLAFGEKASTSTGLEIPELRFAGLPATGTQEINDTDIPATGSKVTAAVYTDNKQKMLRRVTGTPVAGEFSVAAGAITVGPGSEGQIIGYRILKTVPTCETIGLDDAAVRFATFSLSGVLKTDSPYTVTKIDIPVLSQEEDPSLDIQSPTKFDLKYTLITEPGKPRPFVLYDIPVA